MTFVDYNKSWQFSHRFLPSQNQLHSVARDTRFDAALGTHRAEPRGKIALVAGHNLRPAVRDDDSRHALFRAPAELRANCRVSNEFIASLADERARKRRPVPDVNLHIFQRCGPIVMNKRSGP